EFLGQALQMRSGICESNCERAVAQLGEKAVLSNSDADRVTKSYDLLRRRETALRRFENKNVSALPAAPDEQAKLAKWPDYDQSKHFEKDYCAARETIHAIYEQP